MVAAANEHLLQILRLIAAGVAETFGPTCEVVVHDLRNKEIISIENSHVTGRSVGDRLSEEVYDYLVTSASQNKKMTGYPSRTSEQGKLLKCSTLIIPDEKGEPLATFCLNVDIEQIKKTRDMLDALLGTTPLNPKNDASDEKESVIVYARKIIAEAIQKIGKPLPLSSKEGKLQIIKELDVQGIFMVRDVIPSVCELLGISQATLYNYLREVRCDVEEKPLSEKQ